MSETPDELPSRTPSWGELLAETRRQAAAIEALLARLAATEAGLAAASEIVGDYFEGADGHDSMVELRSRLAAVAQREQP